MFGSEYADHPEILLSSLRAMNNRYRMAVGAGSRNIIGRLQVFYVRLFGIPEIGFQVRGMYFRQALQLLQESRLRYIGDAGSGIGCYALALAAVFPKARVVGWDIDGGKLKVARVIAEKRNLTNVRFVERDIVQKKIPQPAAYDLIVTIDVLEHIKRYDVALRHLTAALKPGGYLFLHVPQVEQRRFFSVLRSWEHHDHARVGFSPAELVRELRTLGFSIRFTRHTFGFFGSLAWEIHHLTLAMNQYVAAAAFPFLYVLASIDVFVHNKRGLGVAVLARKL